MWSSPFANHRFQMGVTIMGFAEHFGLHGLMSCFRNNSFSMEAFIVDLPLCIGQRTPLWFQRSCVGIHYEKQQLTTQVVDHQPSCQMFVLRRQPAGSYASMLLDYNFCVVLGLGSA